MKSVHSLVYQEFCFSKPLAWTSYCAICITESMKADLNPDWKWLVIFFKVRGLCMHSWLSKTVHKPTRLPPKIQLRLLAQIWFCCFLGFAMPVPLCSPKKDASHLTQFKHTFTSTTCTNLAEDQQAHYALHWGKSGYRKAPMINLLNSIKNKFKNKFR